MSTEICVEASKCKEIIPLKAKALQQSKLQKDIKSIQKVRGVRYILIDHHFISN